MLTIIASTYPELYILALNNNFIRSGDYHIFFIQIFSSQILHGSLFHITTNAIFIFLFGNVVEEILGKNKFLLFFITSSIFIAAGLLFFSSGSTVGISGFVMALISFFTLALYYKNDPDYKGGITAIVINILIGLAPGVSFVGHLSGTIFGVLFYYLITKIGKENIIVHNKK
ncbi:MAG: rhomboid family intramembrane serine protease [Candidatus Gracilibacteria bacterium]|nr:rhomboid family intramembrane serine protease [Candidatus Gracilibacteria bacterium]